MFNYRRCVFFHAKGEWPLVIIVYFGKEPLCEVYCIHNKRLKDPCQALPPRIMVYI